jgi:hypothetical protein
MVSSSTIGASRPVRTSADDLLEAALDPKVSGVD